MRYVVERDYLANNIEIVKREMGGVPVIGTVKANGYGLGTVQFARELVDNGIALLAAARSEEAAAVRNAGIDCPILLLSPVADENEAELLIDRSITACVGSRDSALLLEETAQRRSAVIEAHLKLDTGFGRYGFLPGEEEEIAKLCAGLPHLKITGCFTHFSNAFGKDPSSVNRQMSVYREMTEKLEQAGMALGMKHAANSTAALRFPETRLDAVRIGSAFLGRLSVPNEWGFQRVGHMECEITSVKHLPKDSNIGYADLYRTPRDMVAAVVPVGHIDGFGLTKTNDLCRPVDKLRHLVHAVKDFFRDTQIYGYLNGKRVPLAGRIGLTNVVFDVTGVDCRPGDIVTLDVNPLMVDSGVLREYV